MKFSIILLLLLPFSVFAWESSVEINNKLEMHLSISCESEENFCQELCHNPKKCNLEAGSCKNCIGASSFISHFYREVGRMFQNTQRKLSSQEAHALLSQENQFIFLDPHGPYNIYSGIGDLRVERHFESLCLDTFFSRPVVLAKLDRRSRVERVSHVICHGDSGAEIFEMSHAGD
jgi:hypothetical protein